MAKAKIKKSLHSISQKIQKFGNAMLTPVLLITFAGVIAGIGAIFINPLIMGGVACEDTAWFKIWNIITEVALIPLRPSHLTLVFVVGIPIGLAKKNKAEACMESLVLYISFVYFLNLILKYWGSSVGITLKEGTIGVKNVAGMLTLDMGILGALAVVGIVIYLHNHYFDTNLPEFLGIYKGVVFIYVIGIFSMLFLALICTVV